MVGRPCRSVDQKRRPNDPILGLDHSHKDSGSIRSRDGVEERDTVLMRGFYKARTKTTPRFRDGISVSGSRNGTLDPESCDYGLDTARWASMLCMWVMACLRRFCSSVGPVDPREHI